MVVPRGFLWLCLWSAFFPVAAALRNLAVKYLTHFWPPPYTLVACPKPQIMDYHETAVARKVAKQNFCNCRQLVWVRVASVKRFQATQNASLRIFFGAVKIRNSPTLFVTVCRLSVRLQIAGGPENVVVLTLRPGTVAGAA